MNSRQNVVLIGVGMVAQTHLRALADLKVHLRLTAVMSRTHKTAQDFVGQAHALIGERPQAVTSLKDLDAVPDFTIIATPPNARLDHVTALANQNIPILLEKPIERTLAAAIRIVEICETANTPLGVIFQHRARSVVADLRALLHGKTLGPTNLVEISIPWWRDQSYYDAPGRGTFAQDGGGVLITQAIHTLDLTLSLLGPVIEVQAMADTSAFHTMEAEDFVTAGLRFQNGAAGTLTATTAFHPGTTETIRLHCANAVATLQSGQLHIAWHSGKTEIFGQSSNTGAGADPMAFTHAWHQAVIADFANAVRTQTAPMVTGRDALAVHTLIDALTRSAREKSAITLDPTLA